MKGDVPKTFHHRLHRFSQIINIDNQWFKIYSMLLCVLCGEFQHTLLRLFIL
ncbi:hypothetical protein BFAG_02213 [Bacteroides fragilis 3_1_12]|uniref:Uncharacterized protein n=1 Tax=Bacteroides fragilis 3_1_12 TaxID=457424 RepID=A0ABN0BKW3_BACFG|nr:hypothetical protein BFAG_02213 [Bacteroides fragilis 3_1_12]